MLLVDMPGAFVIHDVGALSIEYANLNIDLFKEEYDQHLYTDVVVVQRVEHESQEPIESDQLHARYDLQTLTTAQTSDSYHLRISKVVGLRAAEPEIDNHVENTNHIIDEATTVGTSTTTRIEESHSEQETDTKDEREIP